MGQRARATRCQVWQSRKGLDAGVGCFAYDYRRVGHFDCQMLTKLRCSVPFAEANTFQENQITRRQIGASHIFQARPQAWYSLKKEILHITMPLV